MKEFIDTYLQLFAVLYMGLLGIQFFLIGIRYRRIVPVQIRLLLTSVHAIVCLAMAISWIMYQHQTLLIALFGSFLGFILSLANEYDDDNR